MKTKTKRCICCFKELLEGMWREQTKRGEICGECYDQKLKEIGWGNYARQYLGYK